MRDQLLRIIYDLGEQDAIGEASAAKCKELLGADDETFNRLVNQLDQRGYLDSRRAIDSLKLTSTGIRAAEELRR
jgi:Mn-dependent DtxR family transcriptional regulator